MPAWLTLKNRMIDHAKLPLGCSLDAPGLRQRSVEIMNAHIQIKHLRPDVTGVQALKFLMEQHGLKQHDLHEIGSQG